ncbi:SMI1/KNR4 family protein [Peribacillus sp. FSL K6-1552]|uniref:SMI1/KNR4 family protein n=1 Tax=Peribacillus sp. FSL K6-1552 TaxID=2954514 RepID=UPI004046926F
MLQPLTDETVKKAEELFNVTLPNSYIAILKQQNGGNPSVMLILLLFLPSGVNLLL